MNISQEMRESFRRYGMSEEQLDQLRSETLIFHDLGIYGDDFDTLYSIFPDVYGRNLNKISAEFCPSEFSRVAAWRWIWPIGIKPFASSVRKLTLADLEALLTSEKSGRSAP